MASHSLRPGALCRDPTSHGRCCCCRTIWSIITARLRLPRGTTSIWLLSRAILPRSERKCKKYRTCRYEASHGVPVGAARIVRCVNNGEALGFSITLLNISRGCQSGVRGCQVLYSTGMFIRHELSLSFKCQHPVCAARWLIFYRWGLHNSHNAECSPQNITTVEIGEVNSLSMSSQAGCAERVQPPQKCCRLSSSNSDKGQQDVEKWEGDDGRHSPASTKDSFCLVDVHKSPKSDSVVKKLHLLPSHALLLACEFLFVKDLLEVGTVSSFFLQVSSNELLWKHLACHLWRAALVGRKNYRMEASAARLENIEDRSSLRLGGETSGERPGNHFALSSTKIMGIEHVVWECCK